MEKPKMGFLVTILFVCVFLCGTLVVNAQEEDDKLEFTLEDVVVTAQKREEDLQKVPVSIQTMSGEELIIEGKRRLDEIMRGVVGVSSQGSQVGTDFYMRGLGTADVGPPPGGIRQSAVAVLIDGVYQNRGEVVRGGTLDMQRVEIMRGTQSTTLGGSSLAGAVSLVSNDPIFEYEVFGSLEMGNYHLVNTQGVLNVPLSDSQALRISYSTDKRDGYLASNAGNSDLTNARIKYRWQATDALNIVATYNHQDIGGNGVDTAVLTYAGMWEGYDPTKDRANGCTSDCYGATMGDPPIFGHMAGVDYEHRDDPWDDGYPADQWPNSPYRNTKIDQISAVIDWDLGIGTLTVIPSYQKAHFLSTEPPRGRSFRSEDRKQETTQFDMQLTSPADAPFEWLAGVYYYDTEFTGTIRGTGYHGDGGGPGCSVLEGAYYGYCWSSTNPNIQTTYSAYGNLTYPIFDTLRINAGLRYTGDDKSSRNSGGVNGTNAGPLSDYEYRPTQEAEWSDTTYRIGAEYDLAEQAMLYAMYATGYQPGEWQGPNPTAAQELKQWTAGLKSRWFDNRLQLNVEGFHSTYHNRPMQGSISYFSPGWTGDSRCGEPFPGGLPYTYNSDTDHCYSSMSPPLPELISEGIDMEISWLITENDRFFGSVEYLQSTQGQPDIGVTQSDLEGYGFAPDAAAATYNGLAGLASQYDGLTLQNSPEWSANATYSHIFALPDGSTLTPKINFEYRDTYWSQGGGPGANVVQPGNSIQDAYTLWNAYLSWLSSDGRFNISAYIRNIEDKPIKTNLGVEPDPNAPQYVTLAPPRTFGVVLSVRF